MNLLHAYLLPPHCCCACGGTRTPLLDLQRDDDDRAVNATYRFYLCWNCLLMGARIVGPPAGFNVVDQAELDSIKANLAAAQAELDQLHAAHAEATALLQGIAAYRPPLPDLVAVAADPAPTPATPPAKTGRRNKESKA